MVVSKHGVVVLTVKIWYRHKSKRITDDAFQFTTKANDFPYPFFSVRPHDDGVEDF